VEELEISWPSGTRQKLENLEVNRTMRIQEPAR
jgi:hypothetical protein